MTAKRLIRQVSKTTKLPNKARSTPRNLMASVTPILVDTPDTLDTFLNNLPPAGTLYMDLEGNRLSRHGTLDIMTILPQPERETRNAPPAPAQSDAYVVNVHKLGAATFDHGAPSLRAILEGTTHTKAFWDVRNDSDALYAHFGVALAGVVDVQLLELLGGTRPARMRRERVCGLQQAVGMGTALTLQERAGWVAAKQVGQVLFRPDAGGSYGVFQEQELSGEVLAYCANDVRCLPALRWEYERRIKGKEKLERARVAAAARVQESWGVGYDPYGKDRAQSPWASGV